MKTNLILKSAMALAILATLATACKDREAEKRIAALESEIEELKGKKTPEATPGIQPESPVVSDAVAKADEKPEGPVAAINFPVKDYDFGTIKEGQVVEHQFEFTNTGTVPLIISEARPSCGCTVPDWTRNPIPVGGKGVVKAKFDSNGKPNLQQKTITVTANTFPKQTVLKFKAMVLPKNPEPPAAGPLNHP
jgi:hypothetical protein